MKSKYISQSPYKTAGLTRAELFGVKKKRDTSLDGVAAANRKLQKKGRRASLSVAFDSDDYWRFT